MAQLTCQNLTIGYEDRMLVQNLNFSVQKGDYVCIIGENGTGKSTLMKVLLNLKKPMQGEIILGEGLTRKEFGYLTQQKELQKDFPASVQEIVQSGCQSKSGIRPFYNRAEKALAKEAMQTMNILNLSHQCFRELSGGQQQRVLLARALCATEKILFLDEPMTGLDPNVSRELYQTIATLNQEKGITMVMVSHDIQAAISYATHILYLGESVFWGTKEAYLKEKHNLVFQATNGGKQ